MATSVIPRVMLASDTQLVSGTSVATTSGTSVDFTGIPSTATRIQIALAGVSTNGASQLQVQIGSGSVSTSGYAGATDASSVAGAVASAALTSGLGLERTGVAAAASVRHGVVTLLHLGSNVWSMSWLGSRSDSACILMGAASITLGGALDRVRLTTVNGTDTFDAGAVNIFYD